MCRVDSQSANLVLNIIFGLLFLLFAWTSLSLLKNLRRVTDLGSQGEYDPEENKPMLDKDVQGRTDAGEESRAAYNQAATKI